MAIDFTIEFSGLCAVILDQERKNADVLLVAAERTEYTDNPHWPMLTFDLGYRKRVSSSHAYSTVMLPGAFGVPVGVMPLRRQVITLHPDGGDAMNDSLTVVEWDRLPEQERIFAGTGEVDPKYLKSRPPRLVSARISLGAGTFRPGDRVPGPWSFHPPKAAGCCYHTDEETTWFTNYFTYRDSFESFMQIRAIKKSFWGFEKTTILELRDGPYGQPKLAPRIAISNLPPIWDHRTGPNDDMERTIDQPHSRHSRAFFELARKGPDIRSEDELPLPYKNADCEPGVAAGAGDIGCSPRVFAKRSGLS